MEYKPKYMFPTVTLTLPPIEADASEFETYDVDEMVNKYKKRLVTDFIGTTDDAFADDAVGISVEITVKDTLEG